MAWIIWNEYQAPMESRKAIALCSKLYKTEEEQQIFLDFRILKQEQKKQTTKQNTFGFFE